MLDQYMPRRVNINTIRARPASAYVIANHYAIHMHISRVADVHRPEWRAEKPETAQGNMAGSVELNQTWPTIIVVCCPAQAARIILLSETPIAVPPVFSIAIHGSPADDAHILLPVNINDSCRPMHVNAGDARLDHRVILKAMHSSQRNSLADIQSRARFHKECTRTIHARLEGHDGMRVLCRSIERRLDSSRVEGNAVSLGPVGLNANHCHTGLRSLR